MEKYLCVINDLQKAYDLVGSLVTLIKGSNIDKEELDKVDSSRFTISLAIADATNFIADLVKISLFDKTEIALEENGYTVNDVDFVQFDDVRYSLSGNKTAKHCQVTLNDFKSLADSRVFTINSTNNPTVTDSLRVVLKDGGYLAWTYNDDAYYQRYELHKTPKKIEFTPINELSSLSIYHG